MKELFTSFIAVFALFMLGTTQPTMANDEQATKPAKTENPRLVDCSYYTGTIGDNLKVTMYLERYSNGDYLGWYYYNKNGSRNKLALVGTTDYDGIVKLLEFNADGLLTAGFEGSFNGRGEFIGIMYVVHSNKRYSCKLYPAKY